MLKKIVRNIKQKWLYSVVGLWISFKEEKSLIALLGIFFVCVGLGIWLKLSSLEWSIVILTTGLSIIIEIINTSLEAAVDAISFQYNIKVKKIKDIASSATLVMMMTYVSVILIIFIPNFMEVF